jgi:alpha-N-arabinofuranosidase
MLFATAIPAVGVAVEPAGPRLVITEESTPISPYLFGQFLERPSWSGETGPEALADEAGQLPEKVVQMMADLGAPALRFPGGTDVDYMDWTDMISNAPGREAKRPVSKGRDKGVVTNRFGLDEYFSLLPRIGKPETALVVNLRDALYKVRPLAEAAAHAAGLVAYVNSPVGGKPSAENAVDWPSIRAANGHPDPWKARWVSIGNETYFLWPPEKATDREQLGMKTDAEAWAWYRECVIAYCDAIRAVDPSVQIILDGLHDPWRPDGSNDIPNGFRDKLIRDPEIRRRVNLLASHYYSPLAFWATHHKGKQVKDATLSDEEFWYGLMAGPGLFDAEGQAVAFGSTYDEYVKLGYRLAITEWNWNCYIPKFRDRPFAPNVPAALGAAGFLHGLLRHADKIDLATQSMLLGSAWDITAIRADPSQKKEPYWLPQGQVAWLYTRHRGDRVLRSQLAGGSVFANPPQFAGWFPEAAKIALVDAVTTADEANIYVHLINRSQTDRQSLQVALPASFRDAKRWRCLSLTGELLGPVPSGLRPPLAETGGAVEADGMALVSLPPHSVSVVIVPRTAAP